MTHSDSIQEIATALSKAQSEMGGAVKDSANPFFKSKYADLASVWDACRGPLTKHGLAIVQSPSADGLKVSVETILLHTSGQWIKDTLTVTAKEDSPQAVGSAITYLRRYALQSFAGVAPEDDDGEAAQGRGRIANARLVAAVSPNGFDDWLTDLSAVAAEGTGRLKAAWAKSKPEYRDYLTTHHPKNLEALKVIAARANDQVPA